MAVSTFSTALLSLHFHQPHKQTIFLNYVLIIVKLFQSRHPLSQEIIQNQGTHTAPPLKRIEPWYVCVPIFCLEAQLHQSAVSDQTKVGDSRQSAVWCWAVWYTVLGWSQVCTVRWSFVVSGGTKVGVFQVTKSLEMFWRLWDTPAS